MTTVNDILADYANIREKLATNRLEFAGVAVVQRYGDVTLNEERSYGIHIYCHKLWKEERKNYKPYHWGFVNLYKTTSGTALDAAASICGKYSDFIYGQEWKDPKHVAMISGALPVEWKADTEIMQDLLQNRVYAYII